MADFRALTPLVLLAQAGDRAALEQVLKGVQQPLFDYLARLVGNAHLAEDILQEVFVLVWRKLPWLRDPELFRPWIYRIASREAFRRLKKERTWSQSLGQSELDTVAEEPVSDPLVQRLDQLSEHLAAVSPASRVVLILHYQQGLTIDEVASVLELSPGTVKSRLAYGLAMLRQKLDQPEASDARPHAE
jgi:RNA polymerase sigma-70 factor (ECF subfamily)